MEKLYRLSENGTAKKGAKEFKEARLLANKKEGLVSTSWEKSVIKLNGVEGKTLIYNYKDGSFTHIDYWETKDEITMEIFNSTFPFYLVKRG